MKCKNAMVNAVLLVTSVQMGTGSILQGQYITLFSGKSKSDVLCTTQFPDPISLISFPMKLLIVKIEVFSYLDKRPKKQQEGSWKLEGRWLWYFHTLKKTVLFQIHLCNHSVFLDGWSNNRIVIPNIFHYRISRLQSEIHLEWILSNSPPVKAEKDSFWNPWRTGLTCKTPHQFSCFVLACSGVNPGTKAQGRVSVGCCVFPRINASGNCLMNSSNLWNYT